MYATPLQCFIQADEAFSAGRCQPICGYRLVGYPGICERLRYVSSCSSPYSSEVVGMSKSKFTEADVRRAGAELRSTLNSHSDILQPSGRLRLLQNFSLSERDDDEWLIWLLLPFYHQRLPTAV
jgi:hypothetical protein